MRNFRPNWRPIAPLAVSVAVLVGVSFLPPDTALEETQNAQRLSVCAPRDMGPLVMRDRDNPGFEIELIKEVAARLGWSVSITNSAAMGREYNPVNWRLSRANCRVLVGGLLHNRWSESLLELSEPYYKSQWAWVHQPSETWPPVSVGFAPGAVAMDRVPLGQFLVSEGVDVVPMQNLEALSKGLAAGTIASAVTDSTLAAALLGQSDYVISPVSDGPDATGFAIGFWKGDTTLRREINSVLMHLRDDGTLHRLAEKYAMSVENIL